MINGTGRHCLNATEATCITYQSYVTGTAPLDTDNDGMPDTWETAYGLNPNSATDGPAIHANGYSNLENYINDLAGDPFEDGEEPPPGPTVGDVKVCIDAHTFPITQPTTATCDFAIGTPSSLVVASRNVTSGTDGAGAGFSVGAYDGTRQWGGTNPREPIISRPLIWAALWLRMKWPCLSSPALRLMENTMRVGSSPMV